MGDQYPHFSRKQDVQLQRVFWTLLALLAAAAFAIYAAFPEKRAHLIDENGILENTGSMLFLAGFLVGTAALMFRLRGPLRLLHLPIPLLALLAFLDEISFGAVYFGGEAFTLWGYPLDGVHDLLAVAAKIWRDHGGPVADPIVIGALGAAVSAAFLTRRRYMPWIMTQIRRWPAFGYVRFAVIMIGIAMLLDLDILGDEHGMLLEELLEMNGALALLFAAGAMHLQEEEACPDTPAS